MSLHPEQIELTDEELLKIKTEAHQWTINNYGIEPHIGFILVYNLKRENLKLQLIISKLVTNK